MRRCSESNNRVPIPKVKVTLKGQLLKRLHFHACYITKSLNGLAQMITITNKVKVTFNSNVKKFRLLEGSVIILIDSNDPHHDAMSSAYLSVTFSLLKIQCYFAQMITIILRFFRLSDITLYTLTIYILEGGSELTVRLFALRVRVLPRLYVVVTLHYTRTDSNSKKLTHTSRQLSQKKKVKERTITAQSV